jgi:hypothetical protein
MKAPRAPSRSPVEASASPSWNQASGSSGASETMPLYIRRAVPASPRAVAAAASRLKWLAAALERGRFNSVDGTGVVAGGSVSTSVLGVEASAGASTSGSRRGGSGGDRISAAGSPAGAARGVGSRDTESVREGASRSATSGDPSSDTSGASEATRGVSSVGGSRAGDRTTPLSCRTEANVAGGEDSGAGNSDGWARGGVGGERQASIADRTGRSAPNPRYSSRSVAVGTKLRQARRIIPTISSGVYVPLLSIRVRSCLEIGAARRSPIS